MWLVFCDIYNLEFSLIHRIVSQKGHSNINTEMCNCMLLFLAVARSLFMCTHNTLENVVVDVV